MLLTANKLNKKLLSITAAITALFFILFLIILSASIRCEPDDMIMNLTYRELGFRKAFFHWYWHYSFRPLYSLIAFLCIGYSNQTNLFPYSSFVYFMVLYAVWIYSIYKIVQIIFKIQLDSFYQKINLLISSVLSIASIYFLTSDKIEIYGWLSASFNHLAPIVSVFIAIWLIIKPLYKLDFFAIPFVAFISAGSAEHIPGIAISGGLVVLVYTFLSKEKKVISNHAIKKLIFYISSTFIFLVVFITNPGISDHLRETHQAAIGIASVSKISVPDFLHAFFKPHKIIGILLSASSVLLLKDYFSIASIKIPSWKILLPILILILGITAALGVVAYNSISVGRMWFPLDVFSWVLISLFFLRYLPYSFSKVSITVFVFTALIILDYSLKHSYALWQFSSQYDKMVNSLQQEPVGKITVIDHFPEPDVSNQVQLKEDPNAPENEQFCLFHGIKSKISVKK